MLSLIHWTKIYTGDYLNRNRILKADNKNNIFNQISNSIFVY